MSGTNTLVYTSCLCSAQDATAEPLGSKDGRTVVRCRVCRLVRTLERAADYETLYTEGNRYHVERAGHIPYRTRFDHDRAIGVSRLRKFSGRSRWLDVGCANGGFMAAAKDMGYEVEGLELNPAMAAWAERETGCKVHTSWNQVAERHRYDVVSYHDVFEHVADPRRELTEITAFGLKRGGTLILDVPDIHDTTHPKHGMDSHHIKPLEHLWFYDEGNLKQLLAGFRFSTFNGVDRPIPGKLVIYARWDWDE
jgi:SAM-dependent methyltransferase